MFQLPSSLQNASLESGSLKARPSSHVNNKVKPDACLRSSDSVWFVTNSPVVTLKGGHSKYLQKVFTLCYKKNYKLSNKCCCFATYHEAIRNCLIYQQKLKTS